MASQLTLDFTAEEWRVITEHPSYEISNLGNVRRCVALYRTPPRSKVPCLIRPIGFRLATFDKGNGYLYVSLSEDGRRFVSSIHVLVCKYFCPKAPTPDHKIVAHYDGNPRNNNPQNLRWATAKENQEDMVRHGRSQRGERNSGRKLTETDVRAIKIALAESEPIRRIAKRYGVVPSTIRWIKNGRNWYWL